MGCWCLFDLRRFLKSGLNDVKTTLCASTCFPSSQARVTSVNSFSRLKSLKPDKMFSWKSFHFRQSFSELDIMESLVAEFDAISQQKLLFANFVFHPSTLNWYSYLHLKDSIWSTPGPCFLGSIRARSFPMVIQIQIVIRFLKWLFLIFSIVLCNI